MIDPLTPATCDLRDFPFMPLDVQRLRDSDLAASGTAEECWAALLLWAAAWQQVPAASLPDNDRTLANLAGYGRVVEAWLKVRPGALRNFVVCSDGRLYHPVVAEKALIAWLDKLGRRIQSRAGNAERHNADLSVSHLNADVREAVALLSAIAPRHAALSKAHVRRAMAEQPELPLALEPISPHGLLTGAFDRGSNLPREEKRREYTPPPPPQGGADLFDQAWLAYPPVGRTKIDQTRAIWPQHAELAGGQPALLASVKSFAASETASLDKGRRVPSFRKWLWEGRYRDQTGETSTKPRRFNGPPEIRAAVSSRMGEGWTCSWLDPCRWRDVPTPAIVAPRGLTRDRLVDGLRELLKDHEIAIELEAEQARGAA